LPSPSVRASDSAKLKSSSPTRRMRCVLSNYSPHRRGVAAAGAGGDDAGSGGSGSSSLGRVAWDSGDVRSTAVTEVVF